MTEPLGIADVLSLEEILLFMRACDDTEPLSEAEWLRVETIAIKLQCAGIEGSARLRSKE
jgi:hypothetical protein